MKNATIKEAQKVMLDILIKVDEVCKNNNLSYFLDWGTLLGAVRHKGFIPWDDDIDISMPREDFEKFRKIAQKELGDRYFLQSPETDEKYPYYHIPMKIRDNKSKYVESVETGNEEFNQGIYIDIFPLDYKPVGKINYKVQCLYKFLMERSPILNRPFSEFSLQRKLIYPFVYILIKGLSVESRGKIEKFLIRKGKVDKDLYWSGLDFYEKHVYKKEDIFPLKEIEFEGKYFNAPNNCHGILKDMFGDYMKLPEEKDRFSHSKEIKIFN